MIDGCLAWQAGGLIRPESVREATAEYFSGQDLFGQWLEDECDVEPGNPYKMGTSAELFSSWQTYASKAGEPPGSRRAFADNLARRGISHYRNFGGRGFKGIRLRTSQGRQDHDA
jgi:putative DNA primase/helicase